MKRYNLIEKAKKEGGEYVLGLEELGTHACYLIYGELGPGEKDRKVCPGAGHEEILLAVTGDLEIQGEGLNLTLHPGEAVHLVGAHQCAIANPGNEKVVYVMAGGHSESGHHHH